MWRVLVCEMRVADLYNSDLVVLIVIAIGVHLLSHSVRGYEGERTDKGYGETGPYFHELVEASSAWQVVRL